MALKSIPGNPTVQPGLRITLQRTTKFLPTLLFLKYLLWRQGRAASAGIWRWPPGPDSTPPTIWHSSPGSRPANLAIKCHSEEFGIFTLHDSVKNWIVVKFCFLKLLRFLSLENTGSHILKDLQLFKWFFFSFSPRYEATMQALTLIWHAVIAKCHFEK